MQKISWALAVSLAIVFGFLGFGIGYSFTPEYRLGAYDKTTMDLGKPDRFLDLRYMNAMIAHHRGAMLLAQQAEKNAERTETKELAAKILADEPVAIAELYAWKKAWYGDVRMVADPVVPHLGTSDKKFDLRFLNALIAHHDTGLLMTKEIRTKSSRMEILNNADAVDTFLILTRKVFLDWRAQWYNI